MIKKDVKNLIPSDLWNSGYGVFLTDLDKIGFDVKVYNEDDLIAFKKIMFVYFNFMYNWLLIDNFTSLNKGVLITSLRDLLI